MTHHHIINNLCALLIAKTSSAKKKINGSRPIPTIDEKIRSTERFLSSLKNLDKRYLSI
jgi:hypothetical protein